MLLLDKRKRFVDAFMALADVPQDARHHPEGDVLTHTALVCFSALRRQDWLHRAAMFHDIDTAQDQIGLAWHVFMENDA